MFHNKKVLITGHSGFKGLWLSSLLRSSGCDLFGISRDLNFFKISRDVSAANNICETEIDISNFRRVADVVSDIKPDIVFHMAAQSLVRESVVDPMTTFSSNFMGTVNIYHALHKLGKRVYLVNVTSDKVYRNCGQDKAFVESDALGGLDPYSCSKSCAELFSDSFHHTYPDSLLSSVSVRAGNVIGGGDFSADRLIPDTYRAVASAKPITVRMPDAIRPWQHVLDALFGYKMALKFLIDNPKIGVNEKFNVGPVDEDSITVRKLLEVSQNYFPDLKIKYSPNGTVEAHTLKLDTSKIKINLGFVPKLSLESSFEMTFEWYKKYLCGFSPSKLILEDIERYNEL